MILADTSMWVDYMRRGDDTLSGFLDRSEVLCHPFVVGELALGGMKPQTIAWLLLLPVAEVVTDAAVLALIQRHGMAGRGIGYVDAHLIASCLMTPDARLWTWDKSLHAMAVELSLAS